jgi:hypothetical protein
VSPVVLIMSLSPADHGPSKRLAWVASRKS